MTKLRDFDRISRTGTRKVLARGDSHVNHAIAVDPGGVGGETAVVVLAKTKSGSPERDEVDEHIQAVTAAEVYLRGFRDQLLGSSTELDTAPGPPQPPKPDA